MADDVSYQHRRVELETADDMRILIANIKASARSKIDVHLPVASAPAGEPDPLRVRVEEMVDDYIHRTFDLARHSITVNGLPAAEAASYVAATTEEFEPLDHNLQKEVTGLYDAIEKATHEVARLRREQPAATAKFFQQTLEREMADDDRAIEKLRRAAQDEADAEAQHGGLRGDLAIREPERFDEIVKTRQTAYDGLSRLGSELPATAAKLTRANEALDYVLEKERRR